MKKNKPLFKPKKVLVIGSGPIIIGQSAEFDYSGSQACQSLREEGITVVLVNSNPATIQTDSDIADIIYIEPLRVEFLEKIIKRERPDGLLPTMGGQTGLNLAVELEKSGVLKKYKVKLIGTDIKAIETAEDRGSFAAMCKEIGEPIPQSVAANSLEAALSFASAHGYPLVLRPAYTLGGTGGGIARDEEQLRDLMTLGLNLSPTKQVLVEESIIGWAELEYEVMRDSQDNCITICNMENIDPMGIHTGESVVVAPSQTLSDNEYHMLRNAALKIIRRLNIIGGCNIQFALNQSTGEYMIVEVNPRLSRSSALASKATGYPIARVAAKLALGLLLHEVQNAVTKTTPASFEPALDYAVVKIPRWPFDKMPEGNRTLGTQMKSTGEVMAIGRTFEEAFLKALRSLEIRTPKLADADLEFHIKSPTDLRHIAILEAFRRETLSLEQVHSLSGINKWFLKKLLGIVELEKKLSSSSLEPELLLHAKRMGFSDRWIAQLTGKTEIEMRKMRKSLNMLPVYKMVDTCAAEFDAKTPYYYSTYEQENESTSRGKRRVIIIGSGPIRIGQGIEFDYCCCHASFTLRKMGIESVMINNNPETISTDFDASDRLYFEPLTFEDVMNVIELEQPEGVIVSLGGQTSINLAEQLHNAGVRILGTQIEGIDIAEDRDKFKQLLQKLNIPQPNNGVATSEKEAIAVAERISYPIVVRPSYVIAGRAMQIIYDSAELSQYINEAVEVSENRPVLIDKYVERAIEVEVDGICDGKRLFVGGIMEHIERAGVHSGDASCVTPCVRLKETVQKQLLEYSEKIALSLKIIGAINIQYVVKDDKILVLEANPRASRTMPYLSKAIGIPLLKVATEVTMGKSLDELNMPRNPPVLKHYAVKSVVFPFLKLRGVDFVLGPEMKSTGESMGIDFTFPRAYYKALLGANLKLKFAGNVAISLKDGDKERGGELASAFQSLGYKVSATDGTAKYMKGVLNMKKISEGTPNILSLLESGWLDLIINTPSKGKRANTDGFKIRRAALERNIPCITSFEAALALAEALAEAKNSELSVQPISGYYVK
jgi:carbamoyl-phosphate synthase large subunit